MCINSLNESIGQKVGIYMKDACERKVAIFGGNGYMGQHLLFHLQQIGVRCDVYDVHESAVGAPDKYATVDVLNPDYVDGIDVAQYGAVYFLSGLSGPERSFESAELYCKVNELGLLSLCRKISSLTKSKPKIIFPSSRLVYRGGMRVSEDSALEARSVYAANKIACENILSAYHHRYGVPYVALRICVPYGNLVGSEYSYGTVGFFLKCIREHRPITLYGDGANRKTYTYISDLCKIADRVAVMNIASGVYNVGGYDYSLREIANILVDKLGGSVISVPWPEEARRVEMGDISLDSTKLDHAIRFGEYRRFEDVVDF